MTDNGKTKVALPEERTTKVAMPEERPTKVTIPEERPGTIAVPEERPGTVAMPEENSGNVTKPEERIVENPDSGKQVMHRNKNFCPQCGKKYGISDSYCLNCIHPREVAKKW